MSQGKNSSNSLNADDLPANTQTPVKAGSPQRLLPLWHNRDYLLLWSGQLISSIGTQISQLAFPLLVLAITFSPAQAGIVGALRGLPFAVLCLPAGALVDRWDRRKVMLLCDTGRAIALGSIPVALWLGRLSFIQLGLVALVEGTFFTFFSLSEAACLPCVVSQEQLPAATAQNQAIDSISWLLGPLLGGVLYGLGRAVPFLLDTISYACSVLGLFFMRTKFQEERAQTPRQIRKEIGEGLVWLWHTPVLRFLALLYLGLGTPVYGYALILIILAQGLHATPFVIGAIFASSGMGSIAGSFLVTPLQKRITFGRLIIWSAWIWAISWLAFAIAPNPLILGVAVAVSFIIVPIFNATQFSYRLIVTPDHLQGRVNSIFRLVAFGGQPLSLLITGLLIQWIGPTWAVVVLFVPQGIAALAATFYQPLRKTPFLGEVARKMASSSH
ncbi:MFS transporter [Ktedonobacteria bacterium brp13]|nr:MFS transporter [Ktedonobacteria bacterium brp13]